MVEVTDDIGAGLNYEFSRNVQDTVETPLGDYVQSVYNEESDCFEVQYRSDSVYKKPVLVSEGLSNEADAEQLLLEAEMRGIDALLEPSDQGDT